MKKFIVLATLVFFSSQVHAQIDRDLDNDGMWDAQSGGIDRDLDNDGMWDAQSGGIDRDLDNDGMWDQ